MLTSNFDRRQKDDGTLRCRDILFGLRTAREATGWGEKNRTKYNNKHKKMVPKQINVAANLISKKGVEKEKVYFVPGGNRFSVYNFNLRNSTV